MRKTVFKSVTNAAELEQIHRLNHKTFAEELGQYEVNASGELVDRFHELNRYFIAKNGDEVIGMISINSKAPFSIEKRLQNPTSTLAGFPAPCEIRLLSIAGNARNGIVIAGLFWQVYSDARRQGHSHLLISGISDKADMYRALGFRDLGSAVPSGSVSYIPMVMDLDDDAVLKKAMHFEAWWQRRDRDQVSLLPGPVQLSPGVRRAFELRPVSHRSMSMVREFEDVRKMLGDLAGGMAVALMTGSGTLANDAVAACLRSRFGDAPGLLLSNGEFGERLVRQARAAGLRFNTLAWAWGEAWNFDAIEARLQQGVAWVWCVHLETSTGQLNDLRRLSLICAELGVALAADCVSSLGAVPFDGCQLALASGVSGKALGAYAGLAMVFVDEATLRETSFENMPATFNLASNIAQREPMNTIASPQLRALRQALLENYRDDESRSKRYGHYCVLGRWVRVELRRRGIAPLVDDDTAAPVICTFSLENHETAKRCEHAGFQIAYESGYLMKRGWGQISIMGHLTQRSIEGIFEIL